MASEPISLDWQPITAGKVFYHRYSVSGAEYQGLGCIASLDSNAIFRGLALLPSTIPTGTATMRVFLLAAATSGAAKINIKWTIFGEGDAAAATVTAEGTDTVTWAGGESSVVKVLERTLDGVSWSGAEEQFFKCDFTLETSGWTLAQPLWFQPYLIWV